MFQGYLGHCSGDSTWADGYLNDANLGACPTSNPTVIVEATQIPQWVLLAAGAFALLMLLKKR